MDTPGHDVYEKGHVWSIVNSTSSRQKKKKLLNSLTVCEETSDRSAIAVVVVELKVLSCKD